MSLSIVFHGSNAAVFADGFSPLLNTAHVLHSLPDTLETETEKHLYEQADVIIGVAYHANLPRPKALQLYHVPGAG